MPDGMIALWAAVTEQAIEDSKSNNEDVSLPAKRWLKPGREDEVGSFEWICDLLKLPMIKILKEIEND